VRAESAQTLKLLERAAIETTVLPKGHVVIDSELQGEKWCGLKPLLATPQSCVLHEVTSLGHMQEGANGKGVA
jgi:hypothetical protein